MKRFLLPLVFSAITCITHDVRAQWNTTNVVNNTINWEMRITQTDYSGSNDPDGTADPTVRTLLYVSGAPEDEGEACKWWACTSPCSNTDPGGWWTGTNYPATVSMAIYGVAFESDNADPCTFTDGDDHGWEGYYTFRDGLTDMPFLYPSTEFAPGQWIDELGNGGSVWLLPNTAEFDQRMQLAWRRSAGENVDDRLDFGTVALNTEKIDYNSNMDLSGQYSSAHLDYSNLQGDASKDVYYKFSIAQAGRVTISTDHPLTDFDTKVYLTDLDGREFGMDNDAGSGSTSSITAQLPPGTYGIRVEGNGSASGTFRLSVTLQSPQGQPGVPISDDTTEQDYLAFNILGDPGSCNPQAGYRYSVLNSTSAWGSSSGTDPNLYFNLPGGVGTSSFTTEIRWGRHDGNFSACVRPNWQVLIDGEVCGSCAVTVNSIEWTDCMFNQGTMIYYSGYGKDRINVTYEAGDVWDTPDHAQEFALRDLNTNVDIRFKAVMVGTNFTSVLGYFDAPQAPLYILRDPPGDRSFSSVTSSTQSCFGQSYSVSTDESAGIWASARVGVEGSVGIIVETDYEIYGEVGVDLTMGRTETGAGEYMTCLATASEFTTPMEGSKDDVFIGSAIRYAYGVAKTTGRAGCATTRDAELEIVPMEVTSSYNYTESHIRSAVIPQLEEFLTQLTPGSVQYRDVANQLDVWEQTLAMNEEINAQAPLVINRAFNGGGNGQTYSLTQTSTEARTIEMSVYLDQGLSAEFGAYVGGSGVSAGGELRMRSEFGRGNNGTNESTNTMTYHLEDDDAADNFNVGVREDEVYGTYAFSLDEVVSTTSCPYEGGYALDQPELFVGSAGTTDMVLEEVPLSTQAVFPMLVCNTSDRSRTYFLKFDAATNTEGGILSVFGNALNSNDDGVQLVVPAGECLQTTNLTLTQPNVGAVDFTDIELYLYSLCEPEIRSSVSISAYFGEGNAPIGIAEEAARAADWFSLQPNPSDGLFKLEPTFDMGPTTITVFDGVGRVVKAAFQIVGRGTKVIDLQDLPSGAYHLVAERTGEKRVVKLMVQR